MAAPGSLDARYEQLAGGQLRRTELYVARRRLGFSINEWLALPWWQRRVYIEGANDEAEARAEAAGEQSPTPLATPSGIVDAIYNGTAADVAALGLASS